MKDMSYRDKMVILIISIIVILVAGFFALIKPTYNKLVSDTTTYEKTKTEWDGIKQKLDAIPDLKDAITKTYTDAKKDASVLVNTAFGDVNKDYDVKKVNYGLDQYLQDTIDENELKVSTFSVGESEAREIEYFAYAPSVVTYALLENGDVNGNYAADVMDLVETGTILQERETASVLGNTVELKVQGTKENLMGFLEKLKEDNNAINVNSVNITDYRFIGGTPAADANATAAATASAAANAEGWSEMEIKMDFYNAKEIDNPDLGD